MLTDTERTALQIHADNVEKWEAGKKAAMDNWPAPTKKQQKDFLDRDRANYKKWNPRPANPQEIKQWEAAGRDSAELHLQENLLIEQPKAAERAYATEHPEPRPNDSPNRLAGVVSKALDWRRHLKSMRIDLTDDEERKHNSAAYDDARRRLSAFSVLSPSLVKFHFDNDPVVGLNNILGWCVDAMRPVTDTADSNHHGKWDDPSDTDVDDLLAKLGVDGNDYQPFSYKLFVEHHIGPGNLTNAKSEDGLKVHPTKRGRRGENYYLVRDVVRRFYPHFMPSSP